MSPFKAKNGSLPTAPSALTIAPPVPSGAASVIQVIAGSPCRASMNGWNAASRYGDDRITSWTPCRARWSSTWSRKGRSTSGSSSFFTVSVSGRSLVPNPPTRTTAFIASRRSRSRVRRLRDEHDAGDDERDPEPTERLDRLVQDEHGEHEDQHVAQRGERIGERERRAR